MCSPYYTANVRGEAGSFRRGTHMRRSRIGWAAQVVTPWFVGFCLLLAITPEAGQTATICGSLSFLTSRAPGEPDELVPLASMNLPGDFRTLPGRRPLLLQLASFESGEAADF